MDFPACTTTAVSSLETLAVGKQKFAVAKKNNANEKIKELNKFSDWQKFYAAQSLARYQLLRNQLCTVVIPGNSDICAGDKIDIKLVNKVSSVESKDEPYDTESSGVYLIGEVSHFYDTTEGPGGKFRTTLNLMRDSYGMKDRPSNHGTK